MENSIRAPEHQKSKETEFILRELSALIGSAGHDKVFHSADPVFFIVGCARSGTTLVTQYLAANTNFCYPSNFLSRFFFNPYVGALLQKLLFDLDYKGELFGAINREFPFQSSLGKTQGPLAPHEFWYFWRRFFHFRDIQKLTAVDVNSVHQSSFVNELRSIQHVFRQPLFLKAMILNWDIPLLFELVPNCYFIDVSRDLAHNAYSLLRARENFFNDKAKWYSFKPEEFDQIVLGTAHQQVVDQVYFTRNAIDKGLKSLPPERVINVGYESFCNEPSQLLREISIKAQLDISKVTKSRGMTDLKFSPVISDLDYDEYDWGNILSCSEKYM